MALQDEFQGPFLAVLAGAARRGARDVGARASAHRARDAAGTKRLCWRAGGQPQRSEPRGRRL